jgi:subfamily B ATP-binding cassette protein HlyB/CyaB
MTDDILGDENIQPEKKTARNSSEKASTSIVQTAEPVEQVANTQSSRNIVPDDQLSKLDTGLLALTMVARFLSIPADPEHLRHLSGVGSDKASVTVLLRLAKQLELKARYIETKWERFNHVQLPAIARLKNGEFVIIAKAAPDKVLIHHPLRKQPEIVEKEPFLEGWDGTLILLTSRARIAGEQRKFDFSWFLPVIYRYRKLLSEVLIISFFLQLFALISPLFFQVIIDKVLVHNGVTTLHVLMIALIITSLYETILGGLRTYVFNHTTSRIDVELGARLFRHMLSLPLRYFSSRRVGDTVARVRELENIRNFLTSSAVTVLIDSFFTLIFFIVMYMYSPILTLIVLCSIPCYLLLQWVITPILRKRLNEKFFRGAENQSFLVESITGIETLKALAIEPQAQRKWEEQLAGYVASGFTSTQVGVVGQQIAQFINKLVTALVLWVGALAVMEGTLSVGQLVAFNMMAGRVSGPILRMAQLWQDFQQVSISVDRLGDVLNAPPEPSSGAGGVRLPAIKGNISFEHVSFRYALDGQEILKDIHFDVKAGEVIGIVGPSGSGKSTLTKLVQRMYSPEGGRVLVDGTDLAMIDPAWLRRQVGVVLQDNFLFNRSVRENIALADPGMDLARVIQAAQLVGAHDFILELPQGYDTILEERGANLSGGQRQRLAMARALVTNPSILIFDEATSALDYESEHIIQQNMKNICAGRTVFIIAHRLSTVRDANRIITIERGRLVEDGTHEELLKTKGRYAQLHALQSK